MILNNKRAEAIGFLILVLIVAISAGFLIVNKGGITGFAIQNIIDSTCAQTFSTAGDTYNLSVNIDNGGSDCGGANGITIAASNIILDCQNHKIVGSIGTLTKGIIVSVGATGVTIQNCSIQNFDTGIRTNDANPTIINTSIINSTTCVNGLYTNGTPQSQTGCLAASSGPILDTTAPTVTLLNPNNQMTNRTTTQTFNCSATDNINLANFTLLIWNQSGQYNDIAVDVKNRTSTSNTSGWTKTSIPDGNYSWNCNVRDNSSNLANATNNFTFTIDTIPPQWTGTANLSMYNNVSVNLKFNATDATSGVKCFYVNNTLNFSMACSGTLTNITALNTIVYWLSITVNDTADNQNSTLMNITVSETPDVTAPTVTLNSHYNGMINSSSTQNFNCSATDNIQLKNITFYIWNITNAGVIEVYNTSNKTVTDLTNSTNKTFAPLPDGNYTWNCLAYDNSSNSAWASSNRTLKIDTIAPYFFNNATSGLYKKYTNIKINITANDTELDYIILESNHTGTLANYTTNINTAEYNFSNSYNITGLTRGKNLSFRFWANDTAGNMNNSIWYNITILNTPPVLLSIGNIGWNKNANKTINLTLNFTDYDNDDINFSINSSFSATTNLTITANNTIKTILFVPDTGWYGKRYTEIIANDSFDHTSSGNITLTVSVVCGDGSCDASESCSDCAADCGCSSGQTCTAGVCQSDGGGGSGGGGGGGGGNTPTPVTPPPAPPAEPEAPAPAAPPPEAPAPASPDQSAVGDSFAAPSDSTQTGSSCYQLNYTKLKEIGREDLIQKCNITDPYIDIIRETYFDNKTNSTIISLTIDPKAILYNFTYYENIPKCIVILIKAGYINESVIKFKNANFTVVKEDPLIMWQFAKIDKPVDLSYEVLNKKLLDDCLKLLQGLGLADAIETPKASPQESRKSLWIIISVSALIVAIMLYFSRFQKHDDKGNKKKAKQIVPNVKINKPVQQKQKPEIKIQKPSIKPQPVKIIPSVKVQKPVANLHSIFKPVAKPQQQRTAKETVNIANQLLKK